MLDLQLPTDGEGLAWIAREDPSSLHWIPGVQQEHTVAAAAGDQQAIAYLRQRAADEAEVAAFQLQPHALFDPASLHKYFALRQEQEWQKERADQEDWRDSYSGEAAIRIMKRAASTGQMAALQWLHLLCTHRLDEEDTGPMEAAASAGSLDMLKLLRSGSDPAPWGPGVISAAQDHLECLQWLLTQAPACPSGSSNVYSMLIGGNPEALECLIAHTDVLQHTDGSNYMVWAAKRGYVHIMQLLHEKLPANPLPPSLCRVAADRGNLNMLQWLRNQDPPCPWSASDAAIAAGKGDIDMLRWMCSQSPACPMDEECTAAAARHSISMLRVLRSQDPPVPWSCNSTYMAAEANNLPMLQWLCSQDEPCPIAPWCAEAAVKAVNFAMLQYLHGKGCPLSGELYYWAARYGCTDILQWLHRQGTPSPHELPPMLADRMFNLRFVRTPIVMFLGDIGVPLPDALEERLSQARRTFCTFHGLLRWSQRRASALLSCSADVFQAAGLGNRLLFRLAMLPAELINKIAVMAQLQHDMF